MVIREQNRIIRKLHLGAGEKPRRALLELMEQQNNNKRLQFHTAVDMDAIRSFEHPYGKNLEIVREDNVEFLKKSQDNYWDSIHIDAPVFLLVEVFLNEFIGDYV